MKKTLSLLLALLMVIVMVPVFGIGAFAEDDAPTAAPKTTYSIYDQDFETLDPSANKSEILQALGWYIPEAKADKDIADYSIVEIGEGEDANKVLRISTKGPVGLNSDSVVTVYDGDPMAILRGGNYTISYELTYREETTNLNGFSSIIYNYNGLDGAQNGGETYGIVAVRACGAGFNGVYYPFTTGATMMMIEELPGVAEHSLGNRYNTTGEYPSLYARLFLDDPAEEAPNTVVEGKDLFVNKTLNIRLEYDYFKGVYVYVNDVLVSAPIETSYGQYANISTWNDFLSRTSGTTVALMTSAGVVADIDNLSITAEKLGAQLGTRKLPELIITEISNSGDGVNSGAWNEYLEICNPTTEPIDLRDYVIAYADVFDGDAQDAIAGQRIVNFTNYFTFESLLGAPLQSSKAYYQTADYLRKIPGRYAFADSGTTLTSGTRYRKEGSSYNTSAVGELIKFYYLENWNARYNPAYNYDENGNPWLSMYNSNTLLKPGECMLIFTINNSYEGCWQNGVNANDYNTIQISKDLSFRQTYKNRGLGTDTSIKVIAECTFNMADNVCRRYYVGRARDEAGNLINYKTMLSNDLTYIESYVDFVTPLVSGKTAGGTNASDLATLGDAGIHEHGYSANYIYGADASTDYRAGTLYIGRNQIKHKNQNHVGLLTGYQQIAIDAMRKPAAPVLSITEIAPRTLNLKNEEKNAFSAMEITNTSSSSLNLYDYVVVRNELGTACNYGQYFSRAVELRAGNPVDKGIFNGAYYYYVEEHIKNPETCILEPGETVVLWFLNEDTFVSYSNDDDFGVDYFRQYWVNMGNVQMGAKDENGEYITKVIAVDGNSKDTYNKDNADKVLDLAYTSSAMYGIAKRTPTVLERTITADDVISVAYLGQVSTYYDFSVKTAESDGVTYAYNHLDCTYLPANYSMHYIPCRDGSGACSGMVRSLKAQYWSYTSTNLLNYPVDEGGKLRLVLKVNFALQAPDIGMVRGKEGTALGSSIFYPVTDEEGNTTYYYYDEGHTFVKMLTGAAVSAVTETAKLRFDSVVSSKVYNSLAATYGKDFKVGTLIVETEKVKHMETITKEALDAAGIAYKEVSPKLLDQTENYAVLGSYCEVDEANYKTSYTAVSYLMVTLKTGETKIYWSSNSANGVVSTIALPAYKDAKSSRDETYKYPTGTGFYSRYTLEQRNNLKKFSGQ